MSNDKDEDYNKFLVQNTENEDINNVNGISDSEDTDSLEIQNSVDSLILSSKTSQKTFEQCSSAGNIYSDEELSENLQEING
jgi:hypothetical protein